MTMLLDAIRKRTGDAPPVGVLVITRDRARHWGCAFDAETWPLAVEAAVHQLGVTGRHRAGWLTYQGEERRPGRRAHPTIVIYPGTWAAIGDARTWPERGAAAADDRVHAWLNQLVHPFAEGPRLAAEVVLAMEKEQVLAPFAQKLHYYELGADLHGDGMVARYVAEEELLRGFRAELRRLAGMAPEPAPTVRDVGGTGPGGCANAFTATCPAGEGEP